VKVREEKLVRAMKLKEEWDMRVDLNRLHKEIEKETED
jgi:hypothetical protein